ncbi:hypothetical protein NDU88_002319 [Pleurodeles waltl]|uniref:Uncharacterized protein n=1 Tax=Pleurodeles waltl TaxID=8319 RepID=A0AAV7P6G3_PLEWA|nr:hypothetical protein NDU88_002319 [Pleurodeles waltl]
MGYRTRSGPRGKRVETEENRHASFICCSHINWRWRCPSARPRGKRVETEENRHVHEVMAQIIGGFD